MRRRGLAAARSEALTVAGPATPAATIDVSVGGSQGAVTSSPEIVLIAVKMPDLAGAISTAAAWPEATVVAVENGVGADELLRAARPGGGLVAGSLTTSVERADDGSI